MDKTEVLIEGRKKLARLWVCSRSAEDSAILTHCITGRPKTTFFLLPRCSHTWELAPAFGA
jgi:hypothetical protein